MTPMMGPPAPLLSSPLTAEAGLYQRHLRGQKK